ncbi:MAG: O-antigen ligase family protein [Bacteroidetes bacterium]|nr:O-antigen ligase family protein [Bacteroidota bacterium]
MKYKDLIPVFIIYCLVAIYATLLCYPKLIGYPIITCLALSIFSLRKDAFAKSWIFALWLPIVLLATWLIGMLYTDNMPAGWFDIEKRLPIILLPFIIFLNCNIILQSITNVRMYIVIVTIINCLACIVLALVEKIQTGYNTFHYQYLSKFIHPSYLALAINAAIILILQHHMRFFKRRVWYYATLIFLILFQLRLDAKAGIIVMLLILGGYLAISLLKKPDKQKFRIAFFITAAVVLVLGGLEAKYNRIGSMIKALTEKELNPQSEDSNELRILIWRSVVPYMKEHVIAGSGTGDATDVMMQMYTQRNITHAVKNQLNVHSQYFEFMVAGGLVCILPFLFYLLYPLFISLRRLYWEHVFICLLFILNFAVESMLETAAGAGLFALIFNLTLLNLHHRINNTHAHANALAED